MTENKNPRLYLLASPNPADFPVGSPESRAAMRLRLQNIEGSEKRLDVIIDIDEGQPPSAGDWQDGYDGARVRCVLVPVNVPLEDSLRKVGGYEAAVLAEAAKHGLVGVGTLMSLKRGW